MWGRGSAYNFQKVHWFLEELDIDYEHINVGGSAGGLDTPEFLAMNPNGRIPVIEDNGEVIWESNTILRYLAATYSQNTYRSNSPSERTTFERWMDWELSALQPVFIDLFWGYYRTPESERNEKTIKQALNRCENYVRILDTYLENYEFVSGPKFGLGDICVGTCFYRYFNMGVEVEKLENVMAWYNRLGQRKAYQDVIQVPFDELKGRVTF